MLDVESNVSASMLKDAAATALLKRELNSLSKTAVQTRTSVGGAGDSTTALGRNARGSSSSINQLSGRLALLVKTAAALGPAFVPITTAAVPAIAGLTTQIGFSILAAGTAVVAFQGVGDALKAMNDAHLKPTAANLEKARIAMENLSPAAQDFVRKLREMGPELRKLRDAAADGLMPGLVESLDSLDALLPQAERIFHTIGDAMGDALADGAESLAGPRWADFFDFIEAEARPTLTTLAKTVGNLTHGVAEMWMAFDPASDDFADGLLRASNTFDDWAQRLSQTDDFQEFLAYIHDTAPQVLDTLGSIGNAFLQIAEAAAPLGGPVLRILEALADIIADIADSPLGTPIMAAVTAMSALSLASSVFNRVGGAAWKANIRGANGYIAAMGAARRGMVVGAAGAGLLALQMTDVDEKAGFANTAQLALMGTIAGPWGAAIGGGIGLALDFAAAHGSIADEVGRANDALESNSLTALNESLSELQALSYKLNSNFEFSLDALGETLSGDPEKVRTAIIAVEGQIRALTFAGNSGAHALSSVFSPALGTTTRALDIATASTEEFRQQFEQLNAALEGRASWRDYEAAIDAATDALRANGKTLDITTEKGRANQAALDSIASTSLKVGESLQGMDRVRFLQRAREDFIKAAVALGRLPAQAQRLADKLGLLDKAPPVKPKVDDKDIRKAVRTGNELLDRLLNIGLRPPAKPKVDKQPIDAAKGSADGLLGTLGLINGYHAKATISISRIGDALFGGGSLFGPGGIIGSADGGSVPKTGKPYADRHLYMLADGEEIISNRRGQADQFRADRASGRIPGYADGGEVMRAQRGAYWRGSASTRSSGPTVASVREAIDYARLGREIVDAMREGSPLVRLSNAGQGAFSQGADF